MRCVRLLGVDVAYLQCVDSSAVRAGDTVLCTVTKTRMTE